MDISPKAGSLLLLVILALSVGLHAFRISYPPAPAFDEVHFATYAADYVNHHSFYDIHPPLGKLLFAGVLALFPRDRVSGAEFISFSRLRDGEMVLVNSERPYGSFPYVPLRALAGAFGVALIFFFHRFLRAIGVGELGALLGACAIALENAFLLQTRLIFVDGIYLAFGVAALWLYFDERHRASLAGILWGLSLAVKLTAVVFVTPVLAGAFLLRRLGGAPGRSRFKAFIIAGIVVFAVVFLANTLFFSPREELGALYRDGFFGARLSSPPATVTRMSAPAQVVSSFFAQGLVSFINYVAGEPHPNQSPWYLWPAMQVPMPYYDAADGTTTIRFTGNPVVWFAATFAVICAVALVPRFIRKLRRGEAPPAGARPITILLVGFLGSLFPFATFVLRSTFLYHYLPAYLFGIGLLGFGTERLMGQPWFAASRRRRAGLIAGVVLVMVVGFAWSAPFTYGFAASGV